MSETMATPARRRISTWIAVGLLVLATAMTVFMIVALLLPEAGQIVGRASTAEVVLALASMVVVLTLPITGASLAILRPRNPIGWLLLIAGIGFGTSFFSAPYVDLSIELETELPGYRLVDWFAPAVQSLGFVLIVVWLPLLFPDGRLPSPRWRPLAWVVAAAIVLEAVVTVLTERANSERRLPAPVSLDGTLHDIAILAADAVGMLNGVFITLAVVAVIVRVRRSSGIERQQMKWFLAAAALMSVASLVAAVAWSTWVFFLFMAALAMFPIAIGIAVLRYRLYEIDRIISRTIGWALVTGLLVGAFALLVLGSSAVLEPLTGGNTLAVAGSTLVVALLFAPLRARVQRQVDRRFDRTRYDGERTLAAFGERLRDEVDLTTIRADVLATVDHSVRPTSVGLWLRGPEERV